MSIFHIRRGKDIKLKGAAEKQVVNLPLPSKVAIQPANFRGLKPRVIVKADDYVKIGTPIFHDKNNEQIKVLSPVSGKVVAVNRGDKRVLLDIVIESDGKQSPENLKIFSESDIQVLTRETIVTTLCNGGLWPAIRQRPFSKIAHLSDKPKSLFVHAMSTEPLAADVDFILQGKEKEFQAGLNILRKLVDGPVHLCVKEGSQSKALTEAKNVQIHQFSGAHPTGNVSTHIHYVDPIHKGEIVWYVEAQDVLRIAKLFLTGTYSAERIIAVTGAGVNKNYYAKTVLGAPVSALVQGSNLDGMRCISGSVLSGTNVGKNGYVCFYDSQITIVPEGGKRQLLGWMSPGFDKYTFSKTYASGFLPEKEVSLDTDINGSHRAIVLNNVYDPYVTMDIMPFFLLRALIGGDIEEAEKLGILECDEEDFALCTFACPSKTDVGEIIRSGLDLIEKEG
jgi:Na+-transporting NADH:ubiquinone oxidoreductase subunit A